MMKLCPFCRKYVNTIKYKYMGEDKIIEELRCVECGKTVIVNYYPKSSNTRFGEIIYPQKLIGKTEKEKILSMKKDIYKR